MNRRELQYQFYLIERRAIYDDRNKAFLRFVMIFVSIAAIVFLWCIYLVEYTSARGAVTGNLSFLKMNDEDTVSVAMITLILLFALLLFPAIFLIDWYYDKRRTERATYHSEQMKRL